MRSVPEKANTPNPYLGQIRHIRAELYQNYCVVGINIPAIQWQNFWTKYFKMS